ncbi:transaldolase [Acidiferrobacter thiooxydans]|uniref:Transaldolase n=2 Tax=Acidiferrobacter thiooxydans TaxID=163359 RepID=A0A368HDY9_9GAMM|nr:transaldolase [Acidiferrobacter thiooxydans]
MIAVAGVCEGFMKGVERITALGQRIWYDNISRDLLESGGLRALVAQGVRGVTTNPTIFEKAIGEGTHYDADIRALEAQGMSPEAMVRELMISDVRRAADILRPVFDASLAVDGYVSIEVAPDEAQDVDATVAEAKTLWSTIARPNVMIKIPATEAGYQAMREVLAQGINVNVTLIFSPQSYERVAAAYCAALEDRLTQGLSIDRVASVASVFVSRVDTVVDAQLQERLQNAPAAEAKRLKSLLGRAGIANAQRIYQRYKELFRGKDFARLRARGARPQWPLWASTSSKNPAYSATWYIDRLIAPDTINTVPPQTFQALLTHKPKALLEAEIAQSLAVHDGLRREGIDLPQILDTLLDEGLASFLRSYQALTARLAHKKSTLTI